MGGELQSCEKINKTKRDRPKGFLQLVLSVDQCEGQKGREKEKRAQREKGAFGGVVSGKSKACGSAESAIGNAHHESNDREKCAKLDLEIQCHQDGGDHEEGGAKSA